MQHPRMIEASTSQSNPVDLAPNLQIDVNELLGQQLAVFGMPGFGKTNAVALLCEQIAPYFVPFAIFDKEGDFASLIDLFPRGVLATPDNCPTGRDILTRGLQVVYDLQAWDNDHARADVIVAVTTQLMKFATSLPSQERKPCVIVVDEVQHWLPENRGSHLAKDEFGALATVFQAVGSTGRKRGFTPFYAGPKISEIAKSVLYPGMYMFFRTTLHTDVKRYMEYVSSSNLTPKGLKHYIETMPRGKAMIKLPNGRQRTVTLHMRKSEHTSHTPTVQAALNAYGSLPFNPDETYGMFLPESEMVQEQPVKASVVAQRTRKAPAQSVAKHAKQLRTRAPKKVKAVMDDPMFASLSFKARAFALLAVDETLRSGELERFIGSSNPVASAARIAYFKGKEK